MAQYRAVLETRLDADDGLHRKILQHIQKETLTLFGVENTNSKSRINYEINIWSYWCAQTHAEWHYDGCGVKDNIYGCIYSGQSRIYVKPG